MRKILISLIAVMFLMTGSSLAAKKVPGIIADDFSCKGIMIDTVVNVEQLEKAFGKALFDHDKAVFGKRVKYYAFKHGFFVGTDKDGKVVDIIVKDTEYQARDGVRYGSTPAKISRVFGLVPRQFIEGQIWYIFEKKENKYCRFMIEMDTEKNVVESFRITNLPLTDDEADQRAENDDEWDSNDLSAVMIRKKKIDMSAVIKDRPTIEGRYRT